MLCKQCEALKIGDCGNCKKGEFPCPQCWEIVSVEDEFCEECGNSLTECQVINTPVGYGYPSFLYEMGVELEHSEVPVTKMLYATHSHHVWWAIHEIKRDGSLPKGSEITLWPDGLLFTRRRLMKVTNLLNKLPKTKSPSAIHFHFIYRNGILPDEEAEFWKTIAFYAYDEFERLRLAAGSSLQHHMIDSGKRATTIRFCEKGGYDSVELRVFPANYKSHLLNSTLN